MKDMVRCAIRLVAFFLLIVVSNTAGEAQTSSTGAPIGTAVMTTVERGDSYGGGEQYDLKITVKEVVSGQKAWERLRAANVVNELSAKGSQYVLVFVKAEFSARGFPGDKDYRIRDEQFVIVSGNGKEFTKAAVAKPKPEFTDIVLTAGATYEGWLAFLIPEDEKRPLMSFSRDHDDGAVYGIWQKPLFQLY